MFDTVLLAGGRGERLRTITEDKIPKVMVDVQGKPFLERQLLFLARQNIDSVYLCIGHLGQKIIEHFQDGSYLGMRLHYLFEESPQGTAGCLRKLLALTDAENFLVMNGDTHNRGLDAEEFYRTHIDAGGLVTICVGEGAIDLAQDIVSVHSEGQVIYHGNRVTGWFNAGSYFLKREVLERLKNEFPTDAPLSLERNILPGIGTEGNMFAFAIPGGDVLDIGTPSGYRRAQDYDSFVLEALLE